METFWFPGRNGYKTTIGCWLLQSRWCHTLEVLETALSLAIKTKNNKQTKKKTPNTMNWRGGWRRPKVPDTVYIPTPRGLRSGGQEFCSAVELGLQFSNTTRMCVFIHPEMAIPSNSKVWSQPHGFGGSSTLLRSLISTRCLPQHLHFENSNFLSWSPAALELVAVPVIIWVFSAWSSIMPSDQFLMFMFIIIIKEAPIQHGARCRVWTHDPWDWDQSQEWDT